LCYSSFLHLCIVLFLFLFFVFLLLRPPPTSTLFPYTTLFRSLADGLLDHARAGKADQCAGLGDVDVAEHRIGGGDAAGGRIGQQDRKSTRLNSSHVSISYAVFCLKKKKETYMINIEVGTPQKE